MVVSAHDPYYGKCAGTPLTLKNRCYRNVEKCAATPCILLLQISGELKDNTPDRA